jgi:hypothetical protein
MCAGGTKRFLAQANESERDGSEVNPEANAQIRSLFCRKKIKKGEKIGKKSAELRKVLI